MQVRPMTKNTAKLHSERKMPFSAVACWRGSGSFSPRLLLSRAFTPTPVPTPTAIMTFCSEKARETAVRALADMGHEHGVHHVVQRLHQHGDHHRDAELDAKRVDLHGAHDVFPHLGRCGPRLIFDVFTMFVWRTGGRRTHPTHVLIVVFGVWLGVTASFPLGGCVQNHLHAGLAAQGGVDGQIIVMGIAPAVLGSSCSRPNGCGRSFPPRP